MEKHFAALKLLDADSDRKLSRAFSYSELPSSHRICAQQSWYAENSSSLVRQCSYEQICDKSTNTRQLKISEVMLTDNNKCNKWQTTVPYSDFLESSNWQFCKSNNIIQTSKFTPNKASNVTECNDIKTVNSLKESKFPSHCSSVNTNMERKKEHLLCTESKDPENKDVKQKKFMTTKSKHTYEDIKKKFRPLVVKNKSPVKKKLSMCCCSFLCFCVFPVVTAIFALFLNLNICTVCNRTSLFSNASLELQQKIYGQENAISNIVSFLNMDTFYVEVLCLIGGTGVGKSYTAEIITKNFPYKKGIFVYDPMLQHTIDANMLNSFDSDTLLIMENLKIKNLHFFSNIIDILSKNKNKCITVLAIFNIENVDDHLGREVDLIQSRNAISKTFDNTDINFIIVPYESLNEQALEMCIVEVAKNTNLTLTTSQINTIKQSLLLSGSGCKGAYGKVQVIGRE